MLAFHKISLKKDVSSSWDRDLNEEVYAQKTGMKLENVMSSNVFIESLAYTRTLLWLIIRFIEMSTCRRGALLWAIPFHSQCQLTTWWFSARRAGWPWHVWTWLRPVSQWAKRVIGLNEGKLIAQRWPGGNSLWPKQGGYF